MQKSLKIQMRCIFDSLFVLRYLYVTYDCQYWYNHQAGMCERYFFLVFPTLSAISGAGMTYPGNANEAQSGGTGTKSISVRTGMH